MGHKIKTFAKVLLVIGIIACIICFIVGVSQYNKDKDCLQYATVFGGAGSKYPSIEAAGNRAYAGMMMKTYSIVAIFVLPLSLLPLYWFGCLFECVEETKAAVGTNSNNISKLLASIAEITDSLNRKPEPIPTNEEHPPVPIKVKEDADWIEDVGGYVRCPQCKHRASSDFIRARGKCPECGQPYKY